jgi:hypothetical protein
MVDDVTAGRDLLAGLFEANMRYDKALFEQGLKIQAMELTLRSFSDAKPLYDQNLKALRTPELVREHEHSQRLSLAAIAAIRGGQFPSD